jgi:lipoate-protein ligase A
VKWRVIYSGAAAAATNMAIDEAMLLAHSTGEVPPTLRFYGWNPAAVSIGYFQKAEAEIDLQACQVRGFDVVRRLTGGRAVLHDAELTYSLVVKENYPFLPKTITASYRYLSEGLITGLHQLGAAVKMTIPLSAYGQKIKQASSAACFDAPSHYEITYEGRKLVGSAQTRKRGVILQHGSILIRFSPQTVAAILQLPSAQLREKTAAMLARRAVSLEEILGRTVEFPELCSVLTPAFCLALGVTFELGELTLPEQAASRRLAAEKYSQRSWNELR